MLPPIAPGTEAGADVDKCVRVWSVRVAAFVSRDARRPVPSFRVAERPALGVRNYTPTVKPTQPVLGSPTRLLGIQGADERSSKN